MTTPSSPTRVGFIKQLPTFVYVLLCTIAAALGAVVLGVAAATALVVLHIEKDPFSTLFFFGSAVLGLVCGVLVGRGRRKCSEGTLHVHPTNHTSDLAQPFNEEKPSPSPGQL